MGQPVKLSDNLVLDARVAGEASERSLAGQIEFWARIGRAMDSLLRLEQLLRLKRRGEERPLSEAIAAVDSEAGRARVAAVLAAAPFPHFEAAPGRPGLLVKIDEDGTRTIGRFVSRVFQPVRP
ncbi:MAG: hypothetical protein IT370_01185 [Deltaproteobacteria bacterium]|nr:hypothetical protein [Deltaproteobacteria bacterium]